MSEDEEAEMSPSGVSCQTYRNPASTALVYKLEVLLLDVNIYILSIFTLQRQMKHFYSTAFV